MSEKKVLDNTNLGYFYSKLKSIFCKKSDVDSTPTYNSTNLITSGGVFAAIDDDPQYETQTFSSDSVLIDMSAHNVLEAYFEDTVASVYFTHSDNNSKLMYGHLIFHTPSTPPTITWPGDIVEWAGGTPPTISGNKRYELSILKGVAIIIETDDTTTQSGE